MSISPQLKEVEKMLIHHFGAETQGFQGLVDQNDRGKAQVPEKQSFLIFFFGRGGGFQRSPPFPPKARRSHMQILHENIVHVPRC